RAHVLLVTAVDFSALGVHSVGLFVITSSQAPIMSSRTRSSADGFGASSAVARPGKPETTNVARAITTVRIRALLEVGTVAANDPLSSRLTRERTLKLEAPSVAWAVCCSTSFEPSCPGNRSGGPRCLSLRSYSGSPRHLQRGRAT